MRQLDSALVKADSLDVYQPQTLYWKATPVFTRAGGCDGIQQLTVRILSGFERANLSQRVLRIYVSSEADLLFLYVLDLTEADFQAIRAAENIRVDYANFPSKLIGLLEKCIACQEEDVPRFQAVLQAQGPQASFKVVENNDFKQVPHITLTFRPGSDAAVKQFLAFRLTELKSDCSQLSSELERTQTERNILQSSLTEAKRLLCQTKEQHDKHLLEYEADVKTREATSLQARARELADLSEQHSRERAELERKYRGQLDVVEGRLSEVDAENRCLRELKFQLDSRVSELSHKLGAVEGTCQAAEAEVERLRALMQQLSRDKAERDVELGEALARVHALEDKVETQKGMVGEQAERIRGLEASLRQVEARAEELKAAAAGHEGRAREAAAEVAKGNATIEKLSADLQTVREKLRRKASVMSKQEEELAARDKAADDAVQSVRSLRRELEHSKEDAGALRQEVEELKGKLEESKKQLQSNDQMIRWLNNQITETQLHYGGAPAGLGPSRYTGGAFRPGAPLPPMPSGATTASSSTAPLGAGIPPLTGSALRGAGMYRSPVVLGTGGTTASSAIPAPTAPLGGPQYAAGLGGHTGYRSSFYGAGYGAGSSTPVAAAPASAAGAGAGIAQRGAAAPDASVTPPVGAGGVAGGGGGGGGLPCSSSPAAVSQPAAARSLNLGGLGEGGLVGLGTRAAPTYMMSALGLPVPVTSGA